MENEVDIMTEFLRWKLNNNSIEILEDIMADHWYETIIHYFDDSEKSQYILIQYSDIDAFETFKERNKKINKIKNATTF